MANKKQSITSKSLNVVKNLIDEKIDDLSEIKKSLENDYDKLRDIYIEGADVDSELKIAKENLDKSNNTINKYKKMKKTICDFDISLSQAKKRAKEDNKFLKNNIKENEKEI